MLQDKRFIKIKKQIKNVEELKKELLRLENQKRLDIGEIKHLYYSTTLWLNPERIASIFKDQTRCQEGFQDILLGNDIPFEIDSDGTIEGLEEARLEAIKLLGWIKSHKELKLHYISFSNKKGFHLPVSIVNLKLPEDPKNRLKFIKAKQKLYIKEALNQGINIDDKIIEPTRILKVPGSLNIENGYICQIIDEKTLNQPIEKILLYCYQVTDNRSLIPSRKMMMWGPGRTAGDDPTPSYARAMNCDNDRDRTFHNQFFISNKSYGLKNRYITTLKWRNISENSVRILTRKVMRHYKLTDVFLFKAEDACYGMCLKTNSRRRLEKILRMAKSENLGEFRKTGILRMPVSKKLDDNGHEISDVLYMEELSSERKDDYVSKGHLDFFNKTFRLDKSYRNVHGDDFVKVTLSKIGILP